MGTFITYLSPFSVSSASLGNRLGFFFSPIKKEGFNPIQVVFFQFENPKLLSPFPSKITCFFFGYYLHTTSFLLPFFFCYILLLLLLLSALYHFENAGSLMQGSDSEAVFDSLNLKPQLFINEVLNAVDDMVEGAFDFYHRYYLIKCPFY